MANQIIAQLGQVKKTGDALEEYANSVEGRLNQIQHEMMTLSGFFKGAAALAFGRAMRGWDESAREYKNAVLALGGTTRHGGNQQGGNDQQIAGDIQHVGAGVDYISRLA